MTMLGLAVMLVVALAGDAPHASGHCPCPGDCNADCVTTPDELERAVQAIFDLDLAQCPAADLDGNSAVTSAELLRIALSGVDSPVGCGAATATAAPTASETLASQSPTRTATPSATPDGTPGSMWTLLSPLAAGPRQEVGVASLHGVVYVVGGFDGEGRVEAYDVSGNSWRRLANLPAPRNHAGVAALDGRIYSVGGFAGTGFSPTRDVYRYDPMADRWDVVASLPTARGALAVSVVDGWLHAIGGSAAASVARHDRYDPVTNEWTELAPLPSARNHLAAATIDGRLYVVGGRGGPNTAELDGYDADRDRWEVLAPMPTARSGLAAAVVDGRLVVIGGEVNPDHPRGVFPQVEMYDPRSARWVSLDPMPVPRHGIGAAVVDGLIYVPGGATRAGFEATDVLDALRIR